MKEENVKRIPVSEVKMNSVKVPALMRWITDEEVSRAKEEAAKCNK